MKPRYQTKLKPETQNEDTEKQYKKSPLPPNLQSFEQKLISGNGFIIYK